MIHNKSLNSATWLTVGQMMNRNFKSLHLEDTLKTVTKYYHKYKINTLPVVDKEERLIGVFPKKRLYKALLDGVGLDTPCKNYMVDNPIFVTDDRTYDEYSMVVRVTKSKVDNVVVLDCNEKVVGMIGTTEYFRESLNLIMSSLDISHIEKLATELEMVKDLNEQVQYYRDELEKRGGTGRRFDQVITHNPAFIKIKDDAHRIARSGSTVLLTGESGVGKDMFARGIHDASPRAKHPFIKVNSASIPETLFESELFGYAPGSFTGALKTGKSGYFERADKGTIFLDEIGDMPMAIQVKILQVLQEKEFTRVGGTKKQKVDVRIIAATNKDLREEIVKKTFREDLFYRLNVIEFHLLPLRERQEDILPLAKFFINKYNKILGSSVTGMDSVTRKALRDYLWPGNIRELENVIERAANYVWDGEIGLENLPTQIINLGQDSSHFFESYKSSIIDFERETLINALKETSGNKSAAAKLLKLSRSAFYDRLAKYGVR